MKKLIFIVFLGFAHIGLGCNDRSNVQDVNVESTNATIQAEDFALNAVGGLIRGGITNPTALEAEINKPGDNPYTRIDINNDGNRDIILVDEVEHGSKFEFIAHPGNGVPDQSIAVATFSMEDGQVHYRANYTSYVHDYNNPNYRYYDTFSHDLLWVAWLTTPSRPVYIGVPSRYSFYHNQPRTIFRTKQTTIFHTTNVHVTRPAPSTVKFNSNTYSSKVTPPHLYTSTSRTSTPANHPVKSSYSSYRPSPARTSFPSKSPSKSSYSYRPSSRSSFSSSSRRK